MPQDGVAFLKQKLNQFCRFFRNLHQLTNQKIFKKQRNSFYCSFAINKEKEEIQKVILEEKEHG